MKVIKRDGFMVEFDREKILNAIYPAFNSSGVTITPEIEYDIECLIETIEELDKTIGIEVIQNYVVNSLNDIGYHSVAKKYDSYRETKNELRKDRNEIYQKVFEVIDLRNKDILKENANKDTKNVAVQRDVIAGITTKQFYLKYFVRPEVRRAYEAGEIHLHDLDNVLNKTNCCIFDYNTVMTGGFNLGQTFIREPQSIGAGFAVLSEIMINGSGVQYGGFTCGELDKHLAKYVRRSFKKHFKDGMEACYEYGELATDSLINMYEEDNVEIKFDSLILKDDFPRAYKYAVKQTRKELAQSMEGFETKINTLVTPNGQTAFTTISFGLDTTWEGREISKAILTQRLKGLNGRTAVFPKIVMLHKEGVNAKKGEPNFDIKELCAITSAKRQYPDYLNMDIGTLKEHYDNGTPITPMGCRSFLSLYKDHAGEYFTEGRGNMGVVTVNLVRAGIKNKGNEEGFYTELDRLLELVKIELLDRFEHLSKVKCGSNELFYLEGGIRNPLGTKLTAEDSIEPFLRTFTTSLGYVGINEACTALYGKSPFEDTEVYEKSIVMLQYLKDACVRWKAEYDLQFGLYSTPAENLAYKMNKRDRQDFGIIDGVTDRKYYTNSFHLPVWIKVDPYEKADFEMPYMDIANSGCISYGEFPNLNDNIEAILEAIDNAMQNGIYYYGVNIPSDTCFSCDFEGEVPINKFGEYECPKCGEKSLDLMNIIRRVCGYLGRAERANDGKMQEYKERVKHV